MIAVSDQFEAITDCPRCGQIAVHHMRPPDPIAGQEYEPEYARIFDFHGPVRTIEISTPPLREADYEIIRTCKCGNEWGQT